MTLSCACKKINCFPFSIFKSSSKSMSFFVIEVSNLRCFSLKAYPQNFLDFASPSLSESIIVKNFKICMCFFFSFLFLLFRWWKSNDFHSSCCVYFSSFKMMFNLRNWEIYEFWKPFQSLNLQRSINKKSE